LTSETIGQGLLVALPREADVWAPSPSSLLAGVRLWTLDGRLAAVAAELGVVVEHAG